MIPPRVLLPDRSPATNLVTKAVGEAHSRGGLPRVLKVGATRTGHVIGDGWVLHSPAHSLKMAGLHGQHAKSIITYTNDSRREPPSYTPHPASPKDCSMLRISVEIILEERG
ncbi:hypothetical protein Tco_0913837 [Tanacetum coccineum]